jgi:hypothetical protein
MHPQPFPALADSEPVIFCMPHLHRISHKISFDGDRPEYDKISIWPIFFPVKSSQSRIFRGKHIHRGFLFISEATETFLCPQSHRVSHAARPLFLPAYLITSRVPNLMPLRFSISVGIMSLPRARPIKPGARCSGVALPRHQTRGSRELVPRSIVLIATMFEIIAILSRKSMV